MEILPHICPLVLPLQPSQVLLDVSSFLESEIICKFPYSLNNVCLVWLTEIINDFRDKNHLILNQINFSQKIFQSIEVTESTTPVSTQSTGGGQGLVLSGIPLKNIPDLVYSRKKYPPFWLSGCLGNTLLLNVQKEYVSVSNIAIGVEMDTRAQSLAQGQ